MMQNHEKDASGRTDPEALHDRYVPEGKGKERLQSSQPIIGIPIPTQQGQRGPLLLADAVSAWAIERMQGRVFLIPLWPFPTHRQSYQSLWPLIQSIDGLLLPALPQETNWYTQWKAGESQPGPSQWSLAWQFALAQLATAVGMPLLAIAEGAQQWNVALGGSLQPSAGRHPTDHGLSGAWDGAVVRVRAQSQLAAYLQQRFTHSHEEGGTPAWKLPVVSSLQVEKLASGLRFCAKAEEKGFVAFERRDSSFGLGILARVDWGLDQSYSTALFEAFLEAARTFARIRKQETHWEASRDALCTTLRERVESHQSLLLTSASDAQEQRARPQPLSGPLPVGRSPARLERWHTHALTREELNKRRRQRLNLLAE